MLTQSRKVYLETMADLLNDLTEENFTNVMTVVIQQFWELVSNPELKKDIIDNRKVTTSSVIRSKWGIFSSSDMSTTSTISTSLKFTPPRSNPLHTLTADAVKNKKIVYLQNMRDLLVVLNEQNFDAIFADFIHEFKLFTEMKKHLTSRAPQDWTFECVFDA